MAKSNGTSLAKPDPEKPRSQVMQAAAPALKVKAFLEASEDRLAAVLPRHMSPAKQIQIVTTLVFKTPKLQQCAPASILSAVMEASELGLSLSRSAGEAYLVPYWNSRAGCNECQFQPGYRGLSKLAYQSGIVSLVQGRLVRAGEPFRYAYNPDLDFYHEPKADDADAPVTHAYAFAKLANGERLIEVMTINQVESIRKRSKSANEGPWITDWEEMAKKTPLRRLCKILPRSEELDRAIEADDRQYEDGPRTVVSAPPRGLSRADAMAAALEGPGEPEFAPGTSGQIRTEADDDMPFGDELANPDQGQDADS